MVRYICSLTAQAITYLPSHSCKRSEVVDGGFLSACNITTYSVQIFLYWRGAQYINDASSITTSQFIKVEDFFHDK